MLCLCRYARISGRLRLSTSLYPRIWRKAVFPPITQIALRTVSTQTPPLAPFTLRPYQEECIQAVVSALREGHRQVGVSLATGSGKTVIFTELIDRVPAPNTKATKALILVHRRELVEQAARQCSRRYPTRTVEIEMGSLCASGQADITVASIQSINSRDRIDKFDPQTFKLIIVDEAHHIVSPAYLTVLSHFGLVEYGTLSSSPSSLISTPALVGVSATMSRLDGLALGKVIKHIVFHKDYVDMIGEKWLADVVFTTVATNADLSGVKKGATGDFLSTSLSRVINTDEINTITVRAWQHRARDRKSTVVFCADLQHVVSLTNAFRSAGVDAQFITGDTNKAIRSQRLDDFRAGKFPVLVNCEILTEGTDIPNIDCVLLARPTKSRNLIVQMIGRGMRLFPGKQNCHVVDMVSSLKTGIVTTPTLFGLDPDEIVKELDVASLRNLRTRKEREKQQRLVQNSINADAARAQQRISGTVTFTDYDSVVDLIEDSSSERHIRALSPNAWVHVGDERYILSNGSAGSYLMLEKLEQSDYQVKITRKLPTVNPKSSPYTRPRVVVLAQTFEAAVRGADTYAAKHFTRVWIATFTHSGWRNGPASQAQIDFLNKFRETDHQLTTEDVSKGKAADMITKIKFGAKGRLKQAAKDKRREKIKATKLAEWDVQKRREQVVVGPVVDYDVMRPVINQ